VATQQTTSAAGARIHFGTEEEVSPSPSTQSIGGSANSSEPEPEPEPEPEGSSNKIMPEPEPEPEPSAGAEDTLDAATTGEHDADTEDNQGSTEGDNDIHNDSDIDNGGGGQDSEWDALGPEADGLESDFRFDLKDMKIDKVLGAHLIHYCIKML
jgi:hypothetical protein